VNIRTILQAAAISAMAATASGFAQTWTNISNALLISLSSQAWPGGCSGIAVNRVTGDVYLGVLWKGLYKSNNQGAAWTPMDNNNFTGTCNNAWSLQVDQNNPARVAVFALDGTGYSTVDGTTLRKMNPQGRGWDFGSVDWQSADAQVMLATQHESGGLLFKSTDGGSTWTQLSITVVATGGGSNANAMIGVIDASTFVCCQGSGILRSTDQGSNWIKVSSVNPQAHVPVQFKGVFYLGTAAGLLASKDNGATWSLQGASVNIYQGPFFGSDENTMVVAGATGIYRSSNAGVSWTKIANVHPDIDPSFSYSASWFGCYSWDPIGNVIYAAAMGSANAAFRYSLTTPVENREAIPVPRGAVSRAALTLLFHGGVAGAANIDRPGPCYNVKGQPLANESRSRAGQAVVIAHP
jgi:photosystem II stability/assembly factor-like uncharacterized protein